jgi:hypothetical protein
MSKIPVVTLLLGLAGMLLGGCVVLVSVLLPVLTHGRTSWGEAMMGLVPGTLVLVVSVPLALIGLVVILVRRKKALQ